MKETDRERWRWRGEYQSIASTAGLLLLALEGYEKGTPEKGKKRKTESRSFHTYSRKAVSSKVRLGKKSEAFPLRLHKPHILANAVNLPCDALERAYAGTEPYHKSRTSPSSSTLLGCVRRIGGEVGGIRRFGWL